MPKTIIAKLHYCLTCRSVSTRQLEGIDLCKGPVVAALAKVSMEVHASVVTAADQFFQQLQRRYVLKHTCQHQPLDCSHVQTCRSTRHHKL